MTSSKTKKRIKICIICRSVFSILSRLAKVKADCIWIVYPGVLDYCIYIVYPGVHFRSADAKSRRDLLKERKKSEKKAQGGFSRKFPSLWFLSLNRHSQNDRFSKKARLKINILHAQFTSLRVTTRSPHMSKQSEDFQGWQNFFVVFKAWTTDAS